MSFVSPERNKSNRGRVTILPTARRRDDFAELLAANDAKPPFRFRKKTSRPRGHDETLDKVFQGLLKKANRELANLLRDVHAGPGTTSPIVIRLSSFKLTRCLSMLRSWDRMATRLRWLRRFSGTG